MNRVRDSRSSVSTFYYLLGGVKYLDQGDSYYYSPGVFRRQVGTNWLPRWSPKSTGLLPTVRPLMAELPDVEEFIGRAGGRERAAEMNE